MLEAGLPLLDCIRSSPTGATRCPRRTGVSELPHNRLRHAVCAGLADLARPVDAETPDRPQSTKTQFSRRLAARGASVVTFDLPARLEVPSRRVPKKWKNPFGRASSTAQRCPWDPVASGTIEGNIRSPLTLGAPRKMPTSSISAYLAHLEEVPERSPRAETNKSTYGELLGSPRATFPWVYFNLKLP